MLVCGKLNRPKNRTEKKFDPPPQDAPAPLQRRGGWDPAVYTEGPPIAWGASPGTALAFQPSSIDATRPWYIHSSLPGVLHDPPAVVQHPPNPPSQHWTALDTARTTRCPTSLHATPPPVSPRRGAPGVHAAPTQAGPALSPQINESRDRGDWALPNSKKKKRKLGSLSHVRAVVTNGGREVVQGAP